MLESKLGCCCQRAGVDIIVVIGIIITLAEICFDDVDDCCNKVGNLNLIQRAKLWAEVRQNTGLRGRQLHNFVRHLISIIEDATEGEIRQAYEEAISVN